MPFKDVEGIFLADLGDQNDGIRSLHFDLRRAERLSDQALDPVPYHAFAVLFSDRNAHRRLLRGTVDHRK